MVKSLKNDKNNHSLIIFKRIEHITIRDYKIRKGRNKKNQNKYFKIKENEDQSKDFKWLRKVIEC